MHSSLSLEEVAQIQQDRKGMGWLSLIVGAALMTFSFFPAPPNIRGFASIFILGFGFAEIGMTYLITGRHMDKESDQQRWIAGFFWIICMVATIIIITFENTPMR